MNSAHQSPLEWTPLVDLVSRCARRFAGKRWRSSHCLLRPLDLELPLYSSQSAQCLIRIPTGCLVYTMLRTTLPGKTVLLPNPRCTGHGSLQTKVF